MIELMSDPFCFQDDLDFFNDFLIDKNINESEINSLIYIFKKISICNILVNRYSELNSSSFLNGFIYDVLSSLVAILEKRERFFQLNLRSMIENIARVYLNKENKGGDFDLFVRKDDFDFLKKNSKVGDWFYLHNKYIKSCGFVHSSPSANLNIGSKFNELLDGDLVTDQRKMILKLFKVVKSLVDIVFYLYRSYISDIFYRNMSGLKKMVGDHFYMKYFS